MDSHEIALKAAGIIGSGVAIVHGALTQRLMVDPFNRFAAPHVGRAIQRLVPLLLQFSTYNWFIGGVALWFAAESFGREARMATGLLVGSSYLFGALGNLWATRGRHPGWILCLVALSLIVFGVDVLDR